MTLYILQYNSYYNRIVKKENTVADYMKYAVGSPHAKINFNPNNGVDTIQYINCDYSQLGDYVLCVDDDNTFTRWFIVEAKRERSGQYRLQLRRDLLVDFYDEIANSPCFIKKATLQSGNPLIFNSENMTFNQIKTSETALKDETGVPWIVGFIPRNAMTKDTTITASGVPNTIADITLDNINEFEYYNLLNKEITGPNPRFDIKFNATINLSDGDLKYSNATATYTFLTGLATYINVENFTSISGYVSANINGESFPITKLVYTNKTHKDIPFYSVLSDATVNWRSPAIYSECISFSGGEDVLTNYENINNYVGKYVYENSTGNLYKIIKNSSLKSTSLSAVSSNSSLGQMLDDRLYLDYISDENISATLNSDAYYILERSSNIYTFSLEPVKINASVTINDDRYHTIDTPYDIFAMPYGEIEIEKFGQKLCTTSRSLNQNIAIAIQTQVGADVVYDLQLLPYCPIRYLKLGTTLDVGNIDVNYITDNEENVVGVMFWSNTASFSFDIPLKLDVSEPKIESECDMYRLVSPNFNGQFEFNLAKNGGLNYINVDCTYKPYDSYIHLNPSFGELYGQDFNDARGLVCGGDFSLPQISNAWANYQLNNKNYQASFDRQIQNLELKNWTQTLQDKASLISGTIQGGVSGFASGGVGGMAVGLIGSATTGALDYTINETLRNEAIDYTIDQFGYTLGNIQAMPNSLMKTSALTYNNKLFPILEYYTCTDKEKQALRNKLKYNGMTVMTVGTIAEYNNYDISYIQAQLIRLEGVHEDFHLINEIANEINKGAYFTNG